jgi:hypothetical protein
MERGLSYRFRVWSGRIGRRRPESQSGRRREGMGRERGNPKRLFSSLTTPLFSQQPEGTPGGHAPETRQGLRKDGIDRSIKRRRRHFQRPIRGGRARPRQALSMPALNAIRFNPEFKAKYQAMTSIRP